MNTKTINNAHMRYHSLMKDVTDKQQAMSQEYDTLKTFKELYVYLQNCSISFEQFMKTNWEGKEKQETLFRLFVSLGLIPEVQEYKICIGNFNKGTLSICDNKDKLLSQSLKDKGDKSDLSMMNNDNILVFDSKNLNKYNIGKFDTRDIIAIYQEKYKYTNKELVLGFVVKDKDEFINMVNRAEQTNQDIKKYIHKQSTIIIDWNILSKAYGDFKHIYCNIDVQELSSTTKNPLILRLHQDLAVKKTTELIKSNHRRILWGQIPRSGKTYIMAGSILEDMKHRDKSDYLILTTAPTETISAYMNVFNKYSQFCKTGLHHITTRSKPEPSLQNHNIYICSKQFLQEKKQEKKIDWLIDINFNLLFIDESHYGGTTKLAQKTIYTYGKNSITIYITATYFKPANTYNIPKKAWVMWDLEDIKLCQTINQESSRKRLIDKHPKIIPLLEKYRYQDIMNEYKKYPDMHILSWSFMKDAKEELKELIQDEKEGFSIESILALKNDHKTEIAEFLEPDMVDKLFTILFGKKTGRFTRKDKNCFLKRINDICFSPKNQSRWFSRDKPLVIMCFLPCGIPKMPLHKISAALERLLVERNIGREFEIVSINTQANKGQNAKNIINEAEIKAKNNGKSGVLVFSGRQCSLGVTIENCDIVVLLNSYKSYDILYQMMFRCMSEAPDKRCGFVIDLNIQRTVNITTSYAMSIFPEKTVEKAIDCLFKQKLILLNNDMNEYFEPTSNDLFPLTKKLYDIWSNNPNNCLQTIFESLSFNGNNLTFEDR